ncbi:unnamed protein product [Vitrella brassicaformis CCMP3155]|uniref:Uncharacterized protein n=1 Tax=Vitrella brassicaformis (strain CCMP3155) TaxID=1169540 RepID=A0A0G4FE56_VITBC|nr:unnamed protein product [Vitrella brassicaformis CCMP3155]|eukprot:CEM11490.1 unnamed protein product [Vitrella brassicaformis CCMP3155]
MFLFRRDLETAPGPIPCRPSDDPEVLWQDAASREMAVTPLHDELGFVDFGGTRSRARRAAKKHQARMLGEEATDGDWVITDPPPPAQDTTARAAATRQSSAGGAATTSSACPPATTQTPSRPRQPMAAVVPPEEFQELSQNPYHQGGSAVVPPAPADIPAPVMDKPRDFSRSFTMARLLLLPNVPAPRRSCGT